MTENLQQKIKQSRVGNAVYRNSLMSVLAVTKAFESLETLERFNYHLPYRWLQLIDTLSTSSTVAYNQISLIDEDVEEEFERRKERIRMKLNDEKLYSEEEVKELSRRREEIEL